MYLGLDLGTSGVKALLIGEDQSVIGSGTGTLDISRPHSGWSEQDPSHWIKATEDAIQALKTTHAKGARCGQRYWPIRPDAWRDATRQQ